MPKSYPSVILDVKSTNKPYIYHIVMPDGQIAELRSMYSNLCSDSIETFRKILLRRWKFNKRQQALDTVKRLTDNLNAEQAVLNRG
jgi:hypothetical protein